MPRNTTIDLYKRVQQRFKLNPVWDELFRAVARVMDVEVEKARLDLINIRDPKRFHRGDVFAIEIENRRMDGIVNHINQREDGIDEVYVQLPNGRGVYKVEVNNYKDKSVLVQSAKHHGFNYFSDTLSQKDYARIVEWIEHFYPYDSDDNFVRFMGFVKNLDLSMYQLWSEENNNDEDTYPYLEQRPEGVIDVTKGGSVYPTAHVELTYNATISDNPGDDLAHLFYILAPIHLVLQRINAEIDIKLRYTLVSAADITMVQSGYLDIPN